jgi:ABC-type transporter Mla subunit MlaD
MRAIADVAAAAGQARGTMGELSETTTHLKDASEHLPNTLARLDRVLRLVEHLLSSQGQDVEEAIHNFKVVSDDLRELTHSAKKYPAQVLMGEPPPRKERGQK